MIKFKVKNNSKNTKYGLRLLLGRTPARQQPGPARHGWAQMEMRMMSMRVVMGMRVIIMMRRAGRSFDKVLDFNKVSKSSEHVFEYP